MVEQRPNLDGRNMTMMLGPSKAVLAGTVDDPDPDAEGTAPTDETAQAAPADAGEAAGDEPRADVAEAAPADAGEAAGDEPEAEAPDEAEASGCLAGPAPPVPPPFAILRCSPCRR